MHLSYSLFAINNILPFIHTHVLGGEIKREEKERRCVREKKAVQKKNKYPT